VLGADGQTDGCSLGRRRGLTELIQHRPVWHLEDAS